MTETSIWHYWMGDARLGHRPDTHAACALGGTFYDVREDWIGLTLVRADVTCPECLEWIHA